MKKPARKRPTPPAPEPSGSPGGIAAGPATASPAPSSPPAGSPTSLLVAARPDSPLWVLVAGLRAAGWEVRGLSVGDPTLAADELLVVPTDEQTAPSAALPAAAGFERAVIDAERTLDRFRAEWSGWRPQRLLVETGFGGGLLLPRELRVPWFAWCGEFAWPTVAGDPPDATDPAQLTAKFGRATDLLTLTAADRILVPSYHLLHGLPPFCAGRARVLREPVAISRWAPAALPAKVRETGAVAPRNGFVVFLGNAATADGSGDFLRAMEAVWTARPEVQAWIAGHDDALLRRPEAEAWPADRIRFLGSMPPAVLAAFFHEAAAVVSLAEPAVPGLVLRAMASGARVCGPDTPAFRELIRHRENGTLSGRGAWGDLASDLLLALDEPAGGEAMRTAARRLVLDHHSASAAAAAFARLAVECGPDYPEQFAPEGGEV